MLKGANLTLLWATVAMTLFPVYASLAEMLGYSWWGLGTTEKGVYLRLRTGIWGHPAAAI
jgi:hypothetical protein